MNNMTVRDLIEHLAQHDPDMLVKIADPNQPFIVHDVCEHAVDVEEYVDSRTDQLESQYVVVIGR